MQTKLKLVIRDGLKQEHGGRFLMGITEDSLKRLKDDLTTTYNMTIQEQLKVIYNLRIKTIESFIIEDKEVNVIILDVYDLIYSIGKLAFHLEFYQDVVWQEVNAITVAEYKPELFVKPINEDVRLDFIKAWTTDQVNNEYCNRLLITHKDCHDGVGTALSVSKFESIIRENIPGYLTDYEIMLLEYDKFDLEEVLKAVEDKVVFIGDYNFPINVFKQIEEACDKVVMVDHHLSPFKDGCGDLDNVHLDLGRSGATLTHEFFFPNQDVPCLLTLIEDRDIWNYFMFDNTDALNMYLKDEKYNFNIKYKHDNISKLMELDLQGIKKFLEPQLKQLAVKRAKNEDQAKEIEYYTINDIVLAGRNLTGGSSDVLNLISENTGCPSIGWEIKPDGIVKFGLRNYKDDICVETLAKLFGGGGHKQASGFSIDIKELDLEEFFLKRNITFTHDAHYSRLKIGIENAK